MLRYLKSTSKLIMNQLLFIIILTPAGIITNRCLRSSSSKDTGLTYASYFVTS